MNSSRQAAVLSSRRSALAAGALALAASVLPATSVAQSNLPATPATSLVAPLAAAPVAAGTRSQRPQVTCADGQLMVRAQNASLNSILREISRCTGMKITGGVADSRVFGDYGPASAGTVLATLLDGTGANMVMRETADAAPAELILTPRNGGPTPPTPSSLQNDDEPQTATQTPQFGSQPQAMPPRMGGMSPGDPPSNGSRPFDVNGSSANQSPTASTYPTTNSVPADALSQPSTTPASSGIVDSPNPPAPGSQTAAQLGQNFGTTSQSQSISNSVNTSTPSSSSSSSSTSADPVAASPNGVPTPEQIFQELQKLKQQQTTPQ